MRLIPPINLIEFPTTILKILKILQSALRRVYSIFLLNLLFLLDFASLVLSGDNPFRVARAVCKSDLLLLYPTE